MLSRIKFKISPLVNEILDKLPKEVWTSKSTKFLDPAIGGGQFVSEIERRLMINGHSKSNIKSRVYGCESGPLSVNYAVNKYKLNGTYSVCDFLTKDFNDMKFDVVVGNPPFHSTEDGSKRKKPWVQFADKSIDMARIVAFVTPNAWQKENAKYFSEIADKIKPHLTAYKDANEHFDIGEDIGYWVIDKNNTNPVQIIDNNPCSPIYKKMLKNGDRWHYRDFQQPFSDIDKKLFTNEPTGDFNVPIYWTAKQIRYCRAKDVKYKGWKVIVNNSGHYYDANNPDKYSRVDNKMTVGLGAWGIKVNSKQEGLNVLSWVRSKAYQVVVNKMKTGGFNNPFIELEFLGKDKIWTDSEIYKFFKFTKEEIKYIEDNVK